MSNLPGNRYVTISMAIFTILAVAFLSAMLIDWSRPVVAAISVDGVPLTFLLVWFLNRAPVENGSGRHRKVSPAPD